ncbi:MAG: ankyrin repeat domain-containing protein [Legionellales bacterium]
MKEEIKLRLFTHLEECRKKTNSLYYGTLVQSHLDDDSLTDLHVLCGAILPSDLNEQDLIELLEALPDLQSALTAPSKKGYLPLHFAVANNHVQIVEYLLNKLAANNSQENMVDHRGEFGRTALNIATYYGYYQVMQLLLLQGANSNICDNHLGFAPLHNAVSQSRYEAVLLLLKWPSTDRYLKTSEINGATLTPFELMLKQQDVKLLKLFLKNNIFQNKNLSLSSGDASQLTTTVNEILRVIHSWDAHKILEVRGFLEELLLHFLEREMLQLFENPSNICHQYRTQYQALHKLADAQYIKINDNKTILQTEHYLPELDVPYAPDNLLNNWVDAQTRAHLESLQYDKSSSSGPLTIYAPFENTTSSKAFSIRITLKINEFLLAEKLLSTGRFKPKDTKHFIGNAVSYAGSVIPLPILTTAGQAGGEFLIWCIDTGIIQHAKKISSYYPSVLEAEQMVQRLATKLARIYQEPLDKLTKQGATLLADAAVYYMLQTLEQNPEGLNHVTPELFLMRSVMRPPSACNSLLRLLEHYDVLTQDGQLWRASSVLCKPGIKTFDGVYYVGAGSKPNKYGYRYGTSEEAILLGMHASSLVAADKNSNLQDSNTVGRLCVNQLPWLLPSTNNNVTSSSSTNQVSNNNPLLNKK